MVINSSDKSPFEIRDSTGKEFKEIYDNQGRLLFKNWNEIQGSPPITFRGYGKNLTECRIYGNTVQNGTPTPETPVEVQGCGVRTENLFDASMIFENGYIDDTGNIQNANYMVHTRDYIPIKNSSQYVFIGKLVPDGIRASVAMYDAQKNFISRIRGGQFQNRIVFTTSDNCSYVRLSANDGYDGFHYDPKTIMLVESSTALENYIPYGYKLPLTVNGTEYPIYLGQVETRRRIRKHVLTGNESWAFHDATRTFYRFDIKYYLHTNGIACMCSHYSAQNTVSGVTEVQNKHVCFRLSVYDQLYLRDTDFDSVDAFKSYLAAQYAAGTPVTVWYVLAEPETAIVNEPIQKIGDYSDELSIADIPTINGINTISADTTVQPSDMYIKGTIKQIT